MKKVLIRMATVVLIITLSQSAKAQDPFTVITKGAAITKQVYSSVQWIVHHKEQVKMIFRGFHYHHRPWLCFYKDGFVTRNDFRSYRTSEDAYNYFVLGHGDCDAFYGKNKSRICYETPLQAKKYTDQHGPIVDIKYRDNNGKYKSIFDY